MGEDRVKILRAIFCGGLIAGVLDLTYAIVFYGLRGVAPIRIPQSIASGLLGRAAFEGGWTTAVLGTGLHFFIALSMATAYVVASRLLRVLVKHPILCGAAFGAGAYCVMNYVVIPLSAVQPRFVSWPEFVSGLLVHMTLIGQPIAYFARRSAQNKVQ